MIDKLKDPKSLFGLWLALGVALGLSLGVAMGSFTLGLPMGLCASFLVGKVANRLTHGITRFGR